MRTTPTRLTTTTALLAGVFAVLLGAPALAGAEPVDPGELLTELEPVFEPGLELAPLEPVTAVVVVDCAATHAVTVEIENHTSNGYWLDIDVDGAPHGPGVALFGHASADAAISMAENQTALVEVLAGANAVMSETVTLDCLVPVPSHDFLTDCESGEAHVRLTNAGDDAAQMGVAYPALPYVPQAVAPHSSIDWLLANEPNETVAFEVLSDGTPLFSGDFTFDCPPPAREAPPAAPEQPEQPAVAPATATDTTDADIEATEITEDSETTDDGVELAAGADIAVDRASSQAGLWAALALIAFGAAGLGAAVILLARRSH